jgi:hypothetical protein
MSLAKYAVPRMREQGGWGSATRPVATNTQTRPESAGDDPSTEGMSETIPLGRVVDLDDITNAAVVLASDDARIISGAALEVDGGRDIRRDRTEFGGSPGELPRHTRNRACVCRKLVMHPPFARQRRLLVRRAVRTRQ